jgi:hypothetical protein
MMLALLLLQGPQAMGQAAACAEPQHMPLPLGSMAGEQTAVHWQLIMQRCYKLSPENNPSCCVGMYLSPSHLAT